MGTDDIDATKLGYEAGHCPSRVAQYPDVHVTFFSQQRNIMPPVVLNKVPALCLPNLLCLIPVEGYLVWLEINRHTTFENLPQYNPGISVE
jgi:hypothetical protein